MVNELENLRQEVQIIKRFPKEPENAEIVKELSNKAIKKACPMYRETRDTRFLQLIFDIFWKRMAGAVFSKIGAFQDQEEVLNDIKVGIFKMATGDNPESIDDPVSYVNTIISNKVATKCTEIKKRKKEKETLRRGFPLGKGEHLVERYNKLKKKDSEKPKEIPPTEGTGETEPPQFPEDNGDRERTTAVDELLRQSTIPPDPSETEETEDINRFKNWQPEIPPDILRFFPGPDRSRSADKVAEQAVVIELTKKEYDKIEDPVTREIMRLRDKGMSYGEIGELVFPELPLEKAEEKARNLYNYNKKKVNKSIMRKMVK